MRSTMSAASSHDHQVTSQSVRRVGVDTGGTFTDVVLVRGDELVSHKVLSDPSDPSRAISRGVNAIGDDARYALVHGTTVATNALLERKGSRVAFVTTAGFEDMLFLGRQSRPELYALAPRLARPLVAQGWTIGVEERIYASGEVAVALADAEVDRVVEFVREIGAQAVAVCLLHAHQNVVHETRLVEALRSCLPDVFSTASHEVLREFREYERASTTSVNAFVGPIMSAYLSRLASRLDAAERIEVMQSNGGLSSLEYSASLPVHTVLSGPAGGVVGAWSVAEELDLARIVTLDMGGTSTDVSLCDGEIAWTSDAEFDGIPIRVPMIDIVTVGAGGGSVARVDEGGALRVGPESAGADPGPAAYDRGGEFATVTDAHVVLGTLRADDFLGGEMQLCEASAHAAVESIAGLLELDVEAVASDIVEIATASMTRAIKRISMQRGADPSDFALVAFGGAGGLHACLIAEELEIDRVVVPVTPGLLSAYGMLRADALRVVSTACLADLNTALGSGSLASKIESLEQELVDAFDSEEFSTRVQLDLRYKGQSYEVAIDALESGLDFSTLKDRFEARHRALFGHTSDRDLEVVAVRMSGRVEADEMPSRSVEDGDDVSKPISCVLAGAWIDAVQIRRESMQLGVAVSGPLVVTEYSSTTVVPEGWEATRTRSGHLELVRSR